MFRPGVGFFVFLSKNVATAFIFTGRYCIIRLLRMNDHMPPKSSTTR